MNNQNRNNAFGDGDQQGKSKKYNYNNQTAELKKVREYLSEHNVSATMCATALNIYRPNLTRYKQMLESEGTLKVTHKERCKETGRMVCYLSCKPTLKEGGTNGG